MSGAPRFCRAVGWRYVVIALILFCGCAKPKIGGPVSGKVSLGGKPVDNGAITFHGQDGRTDISEIREGNYCVKKPPFGPCKVTILTVPPPPPGNGINPDPKTLRPPGYLEVPERYGKVQTSPLTVDVTADPKTKDFPLDP
jgi:hypothetical protein